MMCSFRWARFSACCCGFVGLGFFTEAFVEPLLGGSTLLLGVSGLDLDVGFC